LRLTRSRRILFAVTTLDFFAAQDAAKRRTSWLLFLFLLAVAAIVAAVHLVVVAAVEPARLWSPGWILLDAAATVFVILCGVGISAVSLTGSGKAVAESCGGRLVNPATRDTDERRLLNVVEEMSIASGVPVPPVFVLDNESGINAFAAGSSPRDAAVAVTRGALEQFTRDELQGVIGHEFSHILNGDMRLNLRLASWLTGIMGLAVIGEIVMRVLWHSDSGSRRSRGSKEGKDANGVLLAIFLIGLGLFLIGYIGVFFGRLIQAAVSRQREYLADASAVQFTRNPDGLAGALKKIAGHTDGSALHHPQSRMLRHFFFSRGDEPSLFDFLLATHPPIEERIRLLDPAFDPAQSRREPPEAEGEAPATAAQFTAHVGKPRARNLRRAQQFLASLPPMLIQAAEDPHGASAITVGLLLSSDPNTRAKQFHQLALASPVQYEFQRLAASLAQISAGEKLPLLDLALAGLRQLSPPEYARLKEALQELIASDGVVDLFEFTLLKLLRRHLEAAFAPAAPPVVKHRHLATLQTQSVLLLSCLAHQGHPGDEAAATRAFRTGRELLELPGAPAEPIPAHLCKLAALDAALDQLALASFAIKRHLLTACVATAASDRQLHPNEAELLRAISDTLDCPIPAGSRGG
jgi:Zn-dependent protease with chaperone function